MRLNSLVLAACCGLLCLAFARPAKADPWNQRIKITFNEPVEVPGRVIGPGTYTFKLLDSKTSRNIVQIYNADGTRLIGTYLTIPNYRLSPPGRPYVTFAERPHGTPDAVQAWFYPGVQYGHEFVYPHSRAMQLAKSSNQPVLASRTEVDSYSSKPIASKDAPEVKQMEAAPVVAVTPQQNDEDMSNVVQGPPETATRK
jgi:hypothetical protein